MSQYFIPLYGWVIVHCIAIMINAAMDIYVHIFAWTYIFNSPLCMNLRMELLVFTVTLRLTFEELMNYFPKWQCHFTFPSAMYKSFRFYISLLILTIAHHFYWSHPSRNASFVLYLPYTHLKSTWHSITHILTECMGKWLKSISTIHTYITHVQLRFLCEFPH